jgi:hypothetical protein
MGWSPIGQAAAVLAVASAFFACSSAETHCGDGTVFEGGRCVALEAPMHVTSPTGSQDTTGGGLNSGFGPDGGRSPIVQGDSGLVVGGSPSTLGAELASRFATATMHSGGCAQEPVLDPLLAPLALASAQSDAQADRIGTYHSVIAEARGLDPRFEVVVMIYSSTALGADDVVAQWGTMRMPAIHDYYTACYRWVGVGTAPASSGLTYITLLLAKEST